MGAIIKAVIVDDAKEDARQLQAYLNRFQMENEMKIQSDIFSSSVEFLEEYHGQYDIIFLDIKMPGADGMETAHAVRSIDEAAGIIFVTQMAQYALDGYEVNAAGFMVKPVGYYSFSMKLEKALRFLKSREAHDLLLSGKDGIRKIHVFDILYVEKERDNLIFHTRQGSFCERGSIKALKQELEGLPFAECMSGCLVNLSCVVYVGRDTVSLSWNIELPLSRRLKRKFSQEFIHYAGGGV